MTCLPSASKCEWADLQYFVKHYNEQYSTCFDLSDCLDLQHESAQPEVMCKDANSNQIMVIERKSIIWPLDYVERHKAEHIFWKSILANLKQDTRDAPYLLHIDETPPTVNHRELKKIAGDLAQRIKLSIHSLDAGSGIQFTGIVNGLFSKEHPDSRDWDEPETGLKIESDEPVVEGLKNPTCTPNEFSDTIAKHFKSCVKKFSTYTSAKRILLFDCVSNQIYSDCDQSWWREFLDIHPAPDAIDEIWSSHNYYENNWAFEKLHHNASASETKDGTDR